MWKFRKKRENFKKWVIKYNFRTWWNKATKSEVENNYINAENKKNEIAKKLENIIETKEKSTEKIKNYEENKNKLETELRFKESRLRFLIETEKEKEGYNKTIKSLLIDCEKNKELANGMHGVLANLINVDKEYEISNWNVFRSKFAKHCNRNRRWCKKISWSFA